LTGIKAFPGEECNRVVMMNRKAHVDFNVLKKLNVGEEAIDVLKKMLTREAINRISAEDALLHPYFNSNRLKLSMEEEEFSLELNEIDRNIEKNVPSFKFLFFAIYY
jgi:serine/threonine protein kinase